MKSPLSYAIVVRDKDYPATPARVLIRGDKAYCDQYLADAYASGGWLSAYINQPKRWAILIEHGHYSVASPNYRERGKAMTTMYHGTNAGDAIREHGFKVAGQPGVTSRYHTPWVALTDNYDLADSLGEVLTVDIAGLRIMGVDTVEQGPSNLQEFVAWVRAEGYDGFEVPSDLGEIGIVTPSRLAIVNN